MLFQSTKPHYEYLRKKLANKHSSVQNKLWDNHRQSLDWLSKNITGRQLALGSLSGLLLLTAPATSILPKPSPLTLQDITQDKDRNIKLARDLSKKVPGEMRPLTAVEEEEISQMLSSHFGIKVTSKINDIRLNRSFGVIGGEQHLYRYPGDNLYKHADSVVDVVMYLPAGIAPGLGAWGYFSESEAQFSEKEKQREKYYLAVQTFLAPGFAENVVKYRDFFKFRKMLIVNPKTGQSVVAVIGDAGPAEWTGKHLGGSPEVMNFLGLAGGPRRGPVLYFFIDDPDDKIPLGPIKVAPSESS